MVKRPDNAIAEVDVFMKDGRYAFNQHLFVKDLRDFWRRQKNNINWVCFDIGMTMYFWSAQKGWQQTSRYRYNGGYCKPTIKMRRQYLSELTGVVLN